MNGMKAYSQKQKEQRLGLISYNNQNCLMKIVEYNSSTDIVVEFQDENKARVHTRWDHWKEKVVKNPYHKDIYGIACSGNKINLRQCKREYRTWLDMLRRCYDTNYHSDKPTYIKCEVCDEWTNYENFYDWITHQENYNKWQEDLTFHLDKDVRMKRNKIYSPELSANLSKWFFKSSAFFSISKLVEKIS